MTDVGATNNQALDPKIEARLITAAEAAVRFGVSRPTVYHWTQKGWITAYRRKVGLGRFNLKVDPVEIEEMYQWHPERKQDEG